VSWSLRTTNPTHHQPVHLQSHQFPIHLHHGRSPESLPDGPSRDIYPAHNAFSKLTNPFRAEKHHRRCRRSRPSPTILSNLPSNPHLTHDRSSTRTNSSKPTPSPMCASHWVSSG